ncbi:MAG TPA: glycosyl hydrolase family 18 protein [Candidatus Limnocylindrales bacterium]
MTDIPTSSVATSATVRRAAAIAAVTVLIASILSASGAFAANPASPNEVPQVRELPPTTVSADNRATADAPALAPITADPAGDVLPITPSATGSASDVGRADLATASMLRPGVQYQEAVAHGGDRTRFTPGGRVSVGFSPRAGDGWSIDGHAPRPLPAGNASGRDIAASAEGSTWAVRAPTEVGARPPVAVAPPVDAPTVDPADVQAANGASVASPATAAPSAPANAGLLRQVFGFLPYWQLSDSSTTLNYDVLSTIAYFSVGADAQGNLLKKNADGSLTSGWGGWASSRLTSVINTAHQKRTRVVLTITSFAWTTSEATKQAALLGSPAARLNLARQAAAAVRDRGVDGINLDFEPIASGHAADFTAFVRTLRAELNRIRSGYQLTFDTTGWIGNYPIEDATASGGADAIFIMGYDYRTAGADPVGSVAPLTGPTYDLTDTVRAFTARVPASKIILGVPYYGRAWSTATGGLHAANTSGTKFGTSNTVIYSTAVDYATKYGRHWDPIEQSPYVAYQRQNCTTTYGCVTSWRQIYYDDAASLGAKYDLVNRYALRGAGMWALGYEGTRTELNRVLAAKFLHDTTPPVVGIKTLAWHQRDQAFTVSWTGDDISGIAHYDVQKSVDGGAWTTWLTATTKTSETFVGAANHGYAFRARGVDGKGNVSAWNTTSTWSPAPRLSVGAFGGVRAATLSLRTAPHTTATKTGELAAGDIVSIVGGPTTADGYTWWQISGPLREWRPVGPIDEGIWAAAGTAGDPWIAASRAPNTTFVDPVIAGLSVGDGSRAFSPNGDGYRDSIAVRWTNTVALDALVLKVYRSTGALVDTVTLTERGAGAQQHTWDGKVGGAPVGDGTYLLELVGTFGGVSYGAPSTQAPNAALVAAFGVTVDTGSPVVAGSLLWTPPLFFPQDRDAVAAASRVSFRLQRPASTTLRIYDLAGRYVKTAWADRSLAAGTYSWTWTGLSGTGAMVPRGWYRTVLTATSAANRATVVKLVLADAFSIVASPASPAGGQTMTLTLHTAEPLRAAPVVSFAQAGRSATAKVATASGTRRYVVSFFVGSGAPGRATVRISGHDGAGHVVWQIFYITVR